MIFGVNKLENGYSAIFYAPKAKEVRIKLFRKGEEQPAESHKMYDPENNRYGQGVFSCCFDTDLDEYLFEVDGRYFLDPLARQIVGDERFGIH